MSVPKISKVAKRSSRGVEDASLRKYYKWLQSKKWDTNYYHVANELPATTPQQKRFAATLVHKGKKKGVADIIIFEQHQGYGGLFIELKTSTGSASIEQIIFLHNMNNQGYLGVFAFSFEEACKITDWYMTNSTDAMPVKKVKRVRQKYTFETLEVG